MKRKDKLIKSINIAIGALESDTVLYNWTHQSSCNCGVIAQAILGVDKKDLYQRFHEADPLFKGKGENKADIDSTWKNAVKYSCPITGESTLKIIRDLETAGLNRTDIVHLEYMDNPAILKKSGIKTVEETVRTRQRLVSSDSTFHKVPVETFWGRLFGWTELKELKDEKFETVEDVTEKEISYYKTRENLILYLKAWVGILGEGVTESDVSELDKTELEGELLNCIADEDYDRAAIVRDEINKI